MKKNILLAFMVATLITTAAFSQRSISTNNPSLNLRRGTVVGIVERVDVEAEKVTRVTIRSGKYLFDLAVEDSRRMIVGGQLAQGARVQVTYKYLHKSERDSDYYTGGTVEILVLPQQTQGEINTAPHVNWAASWSDFKAAIRNRDPQSLRAMMAPDFSSWFTNSTSTVIPPVTPPPAQTLTSTPVTLLDTITGATTLTGGTNPCPCPIQGHFMGDAWTNNALPVGTTSITVTGLTFYVFSLQNQSYTDVVARIQLWNTYSGGDDAVFSNGTLVTADLGPQSFFNGSKNRFSITLPSPITLTGGPSTNWWGVTVNFQGNTGSGLKNTNDLAPVIASRSTSGPYAAGQITTPGVSPTYGYFKNQRERTDFNFSRNDGFFLSSPGYYAQGVAIIINGTANTGPTPTPTPTPTPSCSVPSLTPITDPLAQQFENGDPLDIGHLASAMQTAYNDFRNRVTNNGGQFILTSAYRPPAYQIHLLEVWDRWDKLKDNTLPQCQTLRTQVQTEVNRHGIVLTKRPAGACGFHTQGLAIDVVVNPARTGLPLQTMLNLASQSHLYRRMAAKDPVHFELFPPQHFNCQPQLNVEEDAGEVEHFSANSQSIQTIPTANVFVTVTKQLVNNTYVYSYRVQNGDSRPILAFEVGYDDSTQTSQLVIPPVDWSYDTGLVAGSTTSPTGWSSNLITTEESEFHSIEWRTENTNQNIQPLQSMSGFSAVLPQDDVTYGTPSLKVVFADGSTASAQIVPAPPTLAFSVANYNVGEADAHATVTVTRTGDASGTASVDYRTVDTDTFTVGCADPVNNHGGAYARCDFATVVSTLTFAAGETLKNITVPIIDDAIVEGNETFQVVLSNSVGAILGTPTTATITITNNDLPGQPNPIFGSAFFVRQQYLDFLSREPDVSGFNAWLGVLNGCPNIFTPPNVPSGCDRIFVSGEGFFRSQEFQLKGFYVFRFYKLAFSRLPEYPEIISDMSFVAGATSAEVFARKAQLAQLFTQRQEFQTTYASMTGTQYVSALLDRYQLTSITTPDPQQPDGITKVTLSRADLVTRLGSGSLSRAQILRAVADSDQVAQAEFNNAFVAMQYYGYLKRKPESAGYQAWLQVLKGGDIRTMVNGFMNSTEYRLRFGSPNQ